MAKEKQDRSVYYSDHEQNKEKLSENRSQWNSDFDLAMSFWRQQILFKRDIPNLIANVSEEIVEKARVKYEKVNAEYGVNA